MEYKKLINLKTGEFMLDISVENKFVVSDKTTPKDLIKHFGEEKLEFNDYENTHSNYGIYDLKIDNLYFILTFYFKEINKSKKITHISFILSEMPYTNSGESWDNFDEKKEKEKGYFMEKWLKIQVENGRQVFDWGDVNVYYDFHNISYSCQIRYKDAISGEKLK